MSNKYPAFKTLFKQNVVTCVNFFNSYVLAGIGGDLLVFDLSNDSLPKSRINVLDNISIHGISQNTENTTVCVFGGTYVAILFADFSSSDSCFKCLHKWELTDWVLCCQWIEDVSTQQLQLAVLSAHNEMSLWDSISGIKLANVVCYEKSLLYSATILTSADGWTSTVVVAGTVYNQIIIWAVGDNSSDEKLVIHRLQGHKGVIFSVTYNKKSNFISTTSDDRSVRVWSVTFPKCKLLTADDWRGATINLKFTLFGHISRVWNSYILQDKKIISIGEDSMLCLWDADGDLLSHWETHQGAGVLCLDVAESLSQIVTGGADGGINLWPLEASWPSVKRLSLMHDIPRRIALLYDSKVAVVTENGSLLLFSHDELWTIVFKDPRLSGYCLLEVSPSGQLVALASIKGHIIVLKNTDFKKVLDEKVTESRIYSLHWLKEDTLLSCFNNGNIYVWRISVSGIKELGVVYLPDCKERWTTSAVMIKDTIIYGDRMGNIHSSPISDDHSHMNVVNTIKRVHSRQGVCSLCVLSDNVWSTGRDGTVKQFALSNHSLFLVSKSKLPLEWAAQIIYTQLLGLTVLCFHESNLVLWSVQERRKLASFHCGGGHRSWSCLADNKKFCFVYLKDKLAHVLQYALLQKSKPVLMDGLHVREINNMAYITDNWVVTGGEDGTVRISNFTCTNWMTPVVERNHISSVRSVFVFPFQQLMLLFSAGGRAQIKVWKINLDPSPSLTELNSEILRNQRPGKKLPDTFPMAEIETRYMDLHVLQQSDSTLCILAACSDSFLRIFQYNLNHNEISLCRSVRSGMYCLLRVTSFQCQDCKIVTVTTATDGSVTFWETFITEGNVVPFANEQLHQSGVNGLSVTRERVGENQVLLAMGGDDNTLTVCCYQITTKPHLSALKVAYWTSRTLHSSVITGVQLVNEWIVCSGGDQRITLLSWCLTGDRLSATVLGQYCCSVPDIKGITILQNYNKSFVICVYGVGLEVLELKKMII